MVNELKIALIVGARPNFIKIAPIVRELEERRMDYTLIHTGQHYDFEMSETFFASLGLREPDYYIGIGSGTNNYQTAKAMLGLEGVLDETGPDLVVVVGDVNSTLAGALSAVKLGIEVAHVEAGLRSFDRSMPEEINRVLTDAISDLLFTSCEDADENLAREGISRDKIFFVGNIMIDTLVDLMPEIRRSTILEEFGLKRGEYAFVTLHRPSNVDARETLAEIAGALESIGGMGLRIVFPVHPRTRRRIGDFGLTGRFDGIQNLILLDPLGYVESMAATYSARLVLTDSGGLQEETTYLGIPCLTLRPNTERPVTIRIGTNVLLDKGPSMIPSAMSTILEGGEIPHRIPDLWDGNTAKRIIETVIDRL
ncbi:MAG: UDP-N-acetylglucosamine 2-epimerase (non-hydrolyzing) [Actinomycetota bacterium]|nr:UDP-N-acetylglucosamine 2-epimerase (non-hydrolyzing) [Actinomycetota bacterium]